MDLRSSLDSTESQNTTATAHDIDVHKNVIELNLNTYFISHLPREIFRIHTLQTLLLSQNYLTYLPSEIQNLPIITLYLSSNKFTMLPILPTTITTLAMDLNPLMDITGIEQYTQLETLVLNSCDLSIIPYTLSALTRLTILELHENSIQALPSSISTLTNLQKLSLHNNGMTSLPTTVTALQSLTWLSLHFNHLTALPNPFALPKLERLSLHQNHLTHLPTTFYHCTALKVLSLFRNRITHIPTNILSPLINLQKLSLHQNCITHLNLPNPLQELWIDHTVQLQDETAIENINRL